MAVHQALVPLRAESDIFRPPGISNGDLSASLVSSRGSFASLSDMSSLPDGSADKCDHQGDSDIESDFVEENSRAESIGSQDTVILAEPPLDVSNESSLAQQVAPVGNEAADVKREENRDEWSAFASEENFYRAIYFSPERQAQVEEELRRLPKGDKGEVCVF